MKRIGKNIIIQFLLLSGIVRLRRYLKQRNSVTIFIFHDPAPNDFNAFLHALNVRYNFVGMEEVIRAKKDGKLHELPKYAAVITFDDGHKQNFDLIDSIVELQAPTTIYACSDIVNTQRHFWSNYPLPKPQMEAIKSLPNAEMLEKLATVGYDKQKNYPERQALTLAEMQDMEQTGLISFESHTCFHPILTQLPDAESAAEIADSKKHLETLLDKTISGFAYPNGDYSQREIDYVKAANYDYAVTVEHGQVSTQSDDYKLPRICLNDFGSVSENLGKACGIWNYIKL